jgi:hypothetical protein
VTVRNQPPSWTESTQAPCIRAVSGSTKSKGSTGERRAFEQGRSSAAGRARAQQDGTEYVIHNEDGRIGERIVRRRSVVPPQADRPDVNLPSSMSARNAVCVFSSSLL